MSLSNNILYMGRYNSIFIHFILRLFLLHVLNYFYYYIYRPLSAAGKNEILFHIFETIFFFSAARRSYMLDKWRATKKRKHH